MRIGAGYMRCEPVVRREISIPFCLSIPRDLNFFRARFGWKGGTRKFSLPYVCDKFTPKLSTKIRVFAEKAAIFALCASNILKSYPPIIHNVHNFCG